MKRPPPEPPNAGSQPLMTNKNVSLLTEAREVHTHQVHAKAAAVRKGLEKARVKREIEGKLSNISVTHVFPLIGKLIASLNNLIIIIIIGHIDHNIIIISLLEKKFTIWAEEILREKAQFNNNNIRPMNQQHKLLDIPIQLQRFLLLNPIQLQMVHRVVELFPRYIEKREKCQKAVIISAYASLLGSCDGRHVKGFIVKLEGDVHDREMIATVNTYFMGVHWTFLFKSFNKREGWNLIACNAVRSEVCQGMEREKVSPKSTIWNSWIDEFAQQELYREYFKYSKGMKLLVQMHLKIFSRLFSGCTVKSVFPNWKKMHAYVHVVKTCDDRDEFLGTVLVEIHAEYGDIERRIHTYKMINGYDVVRSCSLLAGAVSTIRWKTYYCDLNLVKNTRTALSFVYDRGKLWKILFDVGNHIRDIITLSLQICMQWLFFGFVRQTQVYHHHRKCNETIEKDMLSSKILVQLVPNFNSVSKLVASWFLSKLMSLPNAMRSIIEVCLRMIFICHGLLNFVFDRGKFDGFKFSTLRTRLFEGVGIDRDLNCEVGLDFGPSLRCGKEEGNE
jgi:hypothetical protein